MDSKFAAAPTLRDFLTFLTNACSRCCAASPNPNGPYQLSACPLLNSIAHSALTQAGLSLTTLDRISTLTADEPRPPYPPLPTHCAKFVPIC